MAFDGEAFVQDMRQELMPRAARSTRPTGSRRSCRARPPRRSWSAGPASTTGASRTTPAGSSPAWVTRMPYEMTDGVIENIAEEVLGIQSKSGYSHLHWLFEFTRALGAPDEVITEATPNVDAVASARASSTTWRSSGRGTRCSSAASSASRTRSRRRTSGSSRASSTHYTDVLTPDDYALPHHPHLRRRGARRPVGEFAERYLDTDDKRRSARAAYFAGAELTRRCWDAFDGATW